MNTDKSSKKTSCPQLVKVDRAFKLAEQWVNNMTKSTDDESAEGELESRPPRLGLGATVPRQSKVTPSNDPVERKLRSKLDSEKRKVAKSAEESARDENVDEDSADEELESRTKAFSKKRAVSLASSLQLQAKKKQK